MIKRLKIPILLFTAFWLIAIVLWLAKGNIFYLFNFGYLGTAIGFGVGLYVRLPDRKKPTGRRLTQFLVGLYMLGFLCLYAKENMQLEGFFLTLLAGFFSGAVIHYIVAKIAGPILFGRGFCGWGCWTAMVLDFLPYKSNKQGRAAKKWEWLRGIHFGVSLILVLVVWFVLKERPRETGNSALTWLIAGNTFYYVSAILLALILRDNRAFCKYLCPVTIFLKTTSRFSCLKIAGDSGKCTRCGACSRSCPMDIDVMAYIRDGTRVLSTECIFCLTCTTVCPEQILHATFQRDLGGLERLRRRHNNNVT